MAYNEDLADRVREKLAGTKHVTEREMFGGLAFMVGGNMCCGIVGNELMVRVGPDLYHDALTRPDTREMDFTGRSMKGMVYVGRDGVAAEEDLQMWVKLGLAYAGSLPAKAKLKSAARKSKAGPGVKKAKTRSG